MKIVKRKYANPLSTISIWFIPTLAYILEKSVGVQMNSLEWLWGAAIALTFSAWMLMNFKVIKN